VGVDLFIAPDDIVCEPSFGLGRDALAGLADFDVELDCDVNVMTGD
jgi:hypothetical protein